LKPNLRWIAWFGIALVVLVVCINAFKRSASQHWERTLAGPFLGTNYTGEIAGEPISSLKLSDQATLQVFRVSASDNPVLCLRNELSHSNTWCRLLVPEQVKSNGTLQRGKIHNISLQSCISTESGYKVRVLCDWVWGGQEGGLIYLSSDYSFTGFALGW